MKFDLMYYLGMNHNEIMRLDLAELKYYYTKLQEVKVQELEVEKIKMEASLAAAAGGAMKKTFAG